MMKGDGDYARMNRVTVQVTITLSTGVQMRGNVFHSKNKTLQEELNKGEMFIEFEPMDGGQKMFLARAVIAAVKEFNVPRVDQMTRRANTLDQFDPYEVLGLKKGANAAESTTGPAPGPPPPCGVEKVLCRLMCMQSTPRSPGRTRPTIALKLAPSQ